MNGVEEREGGPGWSRGEHRPELARRIVSQLQAATFERIAAVGLANAAANQSRIGRSILELPAEGLGEGDAAIVVAAGPSLHRRRSLNRLATSGFKGLIVAADGALGACLRSNVVPHVVVTVDPHAKRMMRWFGDPSLTAPPDDDYFRRQEMDPVQAGDEIAANRALVELVDRYGPRMKVAVATSASPAVVDRCQKAGMELYWWNPMYDDYDQAQSVSRRLFQANRLPCVNGGGNVGTSAWVLAHAVLEKKRVGLVGMDFSYPPDMPYSRTQYYPELRDLFGDRFEEAFVHLENPQLGETWFTDPAYYWFREIFFEMAQKADCATFNCSEGGVLFGPGITAVTLEEFLSIVRAREPGAASAPRKELGHG